MELAGWRRFAVEPVLFLYMSAFMLTSVVEEAFFVNKVCTVNLNYSTEICDNISSPEYSEFKKNVQVQVAVFHQWENIVSHVMPAGLALFLGAWSDKVGRKIPLLMGLAGNLVYSSMIVVNALMRNWPVEMVLLTASLPCALTGGNLTVFMAAFSYLADHTSQKQRTLRTTLLEVAYLIPMPLGVAIGSYLFYGVMVRSYARMFLLNASLLAAAIMWTWIAVVGGPPMKAPVGSSVPESQAGEGLLQATASPRKGFLWGLVDIRLAADSFRTLTKPRPEARRTFLFLVLLAMALYTFQREEKHQLYLYSQLMFHWDVAMFSRFRTFQSALFVLGLLLGVPLMTSVLGLRDTTALMVGAVSHITARLFFSFGKTPLLFYIGGGLGLLGPVVAPVLRSVVSKLVPPSERGKVFAIFSVADYCVPIFSGLVYAQLYKATIDSFPQSVFLVTVLSQILVFFIGLYIHWRQRGMPINQAIEDPAL